jgi:hypothetical protein
MPRFLQKFSPKILTDGSTTMPLPLCHRCLADASLFVFAAGAAVEVERVMFVAKVSQKLAMVLHHENEHPYLVIDDGRHVDHETCFYADAVLPPQLLA